MHVPRGCVMVRFHIFSVQRKTLWQEQQQQLHVPNHATRAVGHYSAFPLNNRLVPPTLYGYINLGGTHRVRYRTNAFSTAWGCWSCAWGNPGMAGCSLPARVAVPAEPAVAQVADQGERPSLTWNNFEAIPQTIRPTIKLAGNLEGRLYMLYHAVSTVLIGHVTSGTTCTAYGRQVRRSLVPRSLGTRLSPEMTAYNIYRQKVCGMLPRADRCALGPT